MCDWEGWVRSVTGGATSRQVGERIGKSHTTALKWMRPGASPEAVVSLAVAYDADVLEALVAAGYLDGNAVKELNLNQALRHLSTVKMTAELYRRALRREQDGQASVFDEPRAV